MTVQFFFDGETYRKGHDYERLKNGVQRTLWALLDGRWHEILDLKREVGQDAVDTRVRDLRKPWYGSHRIEMEMNPSTNLARYRLDLESVTQEWVDKILSGRARPPKQRGLTSDRDELRELLVGAVDDLLALEDVKEAQNMYRTMHKRLLVHRTPDEDGGAPDGHSDARPDDKEHFFDTLMESMEEW